jgi:hypothetical protein
VEPLQERVNELEVGVEALRPVGVVGAVVSAGAGVGVRMCRECQFCA